MECVQELNKPDCKLVSHCKHTCMCDKIARLFHDILFLLLFSIFKSFLRVESEHLVFVYFKQSILESHFHEYIQLAAIKTHLLDCSHLGLKFNTLSTLFFTFFSGQWPSFETSTSYSAYRQYTLLKIHARKIYDARVAREKNVLLHLRAQHRTLSFGWIK